MTRQHNNNFVSFSDILENVKKDSNPHRKFPWIRGVNIGGWLVLERFITPYFFALTDCHLRGEFCWYPGQIDAPPTTDPSYRECDLYQCRPHIIENANGDMDYPADHYTLLQSFGTNKTRARDYMEYHWKYFVTREHVKLLADAGVTHVRVPMPHWIKEENNENEPWINGGWKYFVRFVDWCREYDIRVWPDIHTAPGSQNGFDNSGQLLGGEPTCTHWSGNATNVNRTLRAVRDIATSIANDRLTDIVTGFGILNEPFKDCDETVVRDYNERALELVREHLGSHAAVYIGDLFDSKLWNDGYWLDETKYKNTFLDSHYYHVFAAEPRALSPRQHIAYVCGKNYRDTVSCCYDNEDIASRGISRIVGEWSASFDTLVVAKLDQVMRGIRNFNNLTEIEFHRQISPQRQVFLKHYVEAQMVAYEARDVPNVSRGWFYWTFRTEGGAFAEWDFLRGIKEGWIPKIPQQDVDSQALYGTCEHIIFRTDDDEEHVVNTFPDPATLPKQNWQGVVIDDPVVITHGDCLLNNKKNNETLLAPAPADTIGNNKQQVVEKQKHHHTFMHFFLVLFVAFMTFAIWRVFGKSNYDKRRTYQRVDSRERMVV